MAVDASGIVYVAVTGTGKVQMFTRAGDFLGEWGAPELGSPRALAIDADGNVLVADAANHTIGKFTSDGSFLGQWQADATSIAVDPFGSVYVADADHDRVQKFTSDGVVLAELTETPAPEGRFSGRLDPAVDGAGNVYVLDAGNLRVQTFSSDAAFLTQWRAVGAAIAVDRSGVVYVADFETFRIQKFTGTGELLGAWGSPGTEDGQLFSPTDIAVDAVGNVYVADALSFPDGRIQKFTGDGHFLARVGSGLGVAVDMFGNVYGTTFDRIRKYTSDGVLLTEWGSRGSGDGEFEAVLGVAVDSLGYVYVTDRNSRVQMSTSRGAFVAKWGVLGAGDGQFGFSPAGIAVDAGGDVYVADSGNGRVQAFRPVLHVRLDVKPGSSPNGLNPTSQGRIPVAILSTPDFGAPARVERATLTFGRTGEEASLALCNKAGEDVNGDGLVDLVCHFETPMTEFQPGDTEGLLKGKTDAGIPIGGRDSVRIVP